MRLPISLTRIKALFATLMFAGAFSLNLSPVGALSNQQLKTFNNHVYYFNSEIDCANQSGQTVNEVTGDNVNQLMAFLVNQHGLTIAQAAAITGNLMQESGGKVSPTATNPTSGAYGIAQWLGGRLTNLKNFPNEHPDKAGGTDYTTMAVQLNFLWYEITEGTEKDDGALQALKTDPFPPIDKMVFDWEDKFERAGEQLGDAPMNNRIKNANDVLQLYGSPTQTVSDTSGGGGCATLFSSVSRIPAGCKTTPAGLTKGTGKFGDSNTTVYKDVDKAIARACQLADPSSALFQQVCGVFGSDLCYNFCLGSTARVWFGGTSGYDRAIYMWRGGPGNGGVDPITNQASVTKRGLAHPGDRNPPVGALLFYESGEFGHVVIYLGGNLVMSTDILGKGYVYVTNASAIEDGPWHLPYLGWSPPAYPGYNWSVVSGGSTI